MKGNISLKSKRFIAKIFDNLVLFRFICSMGDKDPSPSSKSNQVRNLSPTYLWSALTLSY